MEQRDCGHESTDHGTDAQDKTFCYACCAERDKAQMRQDGRIVLYLHRGKVTNWPGSLSLPVNYQRQGRHNIAGSRQDVWFEFEGNKWHGTQYGEGSEICRCQQVKA